MHICPWKTGMAMTMMIWWLCPVCKHCSIFFLLPVEWSSKKLVLSSRDRWVLQREDIEPWFFCATNQHYVPTLCFWSRNFAKCCDVLVFFYYLTRQIENVLFLFSGFIQLRSVKSSWASWTIIIEMWSFFELFYLCSVVCIDLEALRQNS